MARKITNKAPTDRSAKAFRKAADKVTKSGNEIAGPSPNPSTNLIIHDIALRSMGRFVRLTLEKGLLSRRYDRTQAKAIVENRSLIHTLAAYGVTKLATRSLPGAAIVGGGLIAKTLYDRSKSRRSAQRAGDKALAEQAEE
ncbi:hypothetical protein [Allopontixanthobacter sediminis]|uniref:Uncharacterized protein n=1 Tax=Allopontixanthobacter sediminis TaxID=1689985 RepID=A0A845B860_9SPHN|nr:hypothetical protein [Allopontixanthobacter sediminis]MXP45642.1 hypothetical protein [Allopontixanthobacter sediminis]